MFCNSRSLGYVVATHQSLAQPKGPTVITWYAALCDGPAAAGREKAVSRSHAQWCEIILGDLRRVHSEIDGLVRSIDVCVWGHGMIRPVPGVLCHPERKQMAHPARPAFRKALVRSRVTSYLPPPEKEPPPCL